MYHVNFILSKASIEGSEILWLLNNSLLINFKLSKRNFLNPTPKSDFKRRQSAWMHLRYISETSHAASQRHLKEG